MHTYINERMDKCMCVLYMCMRTCMCIDMYVFVGVAVLLEVRTRIHIYIRACMCVYVCMNLHMWYAFAGPIVLSIRDLVIVSLGSGRWDACVFSCVCVCVMFGSSYSPHAPAFRQVAGKACRRGLWERGHWHRGGHMLRVWSCSRRPANLGRHRAGVAFGRASVSR